MHEFESVKECPKCGGAAEYHARAAWQPATEAYDFFDLSLGRHHQADACPERMKRICGCGYTWYEKPRDANDS